MVPRWRQWLWSDRCLGLSWWTHLASGLRPPWDRLKLGGKHSEKVPPFQKPFPGGLLIDCSFGHFVSWRSVPQVLLPKKVARHHSDGHFWIGSEPGQSMYLAAIASSGSSPFQTTAGAIHHSPIDPGQCVLPLGVFKEKCAMREVEQKEQSCFPE